MMSLRFNYFYFSAVEFLIIILSIVFYAFFTIGSIILRKKDPEAKSVKILIFIGGVLSIMYFIFLFLPEVRFVYPLQSSDLLIGSTYAIIAFVIIPRSLSISMGISLMIFGNDNRERYPTHLFWGGLLFSMGHVISLVNNLIAYYLSWFDVASLNNFYISYLLLSWAYLIEIAVSLVFALKFYVKFKNIYLIIFCLLHFVQLTLAMLSSIGLV